MSHESTSSNITHSFIITYQPYHSPLYRTPPTHPQVSHRLVRGQPVTLFTSQGPRCVLPDHRVIAGCTAVVALYCPYIHNHTHTHAGAIAQGDAAGSSGSSNNNNNYNINTNNNRHHSTSKGRLYVANAGDSRAVLCRAGGIAYALSEDHKPAQDRETNRIYAAGGFVNEVAEPGYTSILYHQ